MTELVCECCASTDYRIAANHGWLRCKNCGHEGYAVTKDEFEAMDDELEAILAENNGQSQ